MKLIFLFSFFGFFSDYSFDQQQQQHKHTQMQRIPHDSMTRNQRSHSNTMTTDAISRMPEPLRLRGGNDDGPTGENLSVVKIGGVGGGSVEEDHDAAVSIQSENPKADSLSDSKSDLNNNNNPMQTEKEKNGALDVTAQLEKWNKVRESLYSQYGWSSENVNQNSKWDVDSANVMPNLGSQNRDPSVLSGTNQWSTDFVKCNQTNAAVSAAAENALTFTDLVQQSDVNWSDNRWPAHEVDVMSRDDGPKSAFGGAIPRNYRVPNDDAQTSGGNQFANEFNQYRGGGGGVDNTNDWSKSFVSPANSMMSNHSRFPRPITKRVSTSPTDHTIGHGHSLPHPNDQPTNSFTAHFQQMNLQDNIMHPYQQRFTAQPQPPSPQQHPQHQQHQHHQQQQNHIAQMSSFDFGQNDSFATNGWEPQNQYPWQMQFDRSSMMPMQQQQQQPPQQQHQHQHQLQQQQHQQSQSHNQNSFFTLDAALSQTDPFANSCWSNKDLMTPSSADLSPSAATSLAEYVAIRSAIDLVDPSTASNNLFPTAAATVGAPSNSSTIPNWQHSSFYENYW